MKDSIWKHYAFIDEVNIIDKECSWKVRKIKESIYIKMSISYISVEFNFMWFPQGI